MSRGRSGCAKARLETNSERRWVRPTMLQGVDGSGTCVVTKIRDCGILRYPRQRIETRSARNNQIGSCAVTTMETATSDRQWEVVHHMQLNWATHLRQHADRHTRVTTMLLVAAFTASASGQQPAQIAQDRFKTPKVFFEVAVMDQLKRKPVRGLTRGDFVLYDNGRKVTLMSCEPIAALQLILVADQRSLSLVPDRSLWKDLKNSLSSLGGNDRVALLRLSYGNIEWLRDFTNDPEPIIDALASAGSQPRVQSLNQPVFDAIIEAAGRFQPSEFQGSRAILVLSNDHERRSRAKPDEAAERALKTNVSVYHLILDNVGGSRGVVLLPWPLPRPEVRRQPTALPPSPGMADIVQRTGGEQAHMTALRKPLETLLDLMRAQYVISYDQPSANEGAFRTVSIGLTAAARQRHPEAVVHFRTGYYATAQPNHAH